MSISHNCIFRTKHIQEKFAEIELLVSWTQGFYQIELCPTNDGLLDNKMQFCFTAVNWTSGDFKLFLEYLSHLKSMYGFSPIFEHHFQSILMVTHYADNSELPFSKTRMNEVSSVSDMWERI